ncbi:hypothetical protein V8G54_026359, partial [Vigna mungo]
VTSLRLSNHEEDKHIYILHQYDRYWTISTLYVTIYFILKIVVIFPRLFLHCVVLPRKVEVSFSLYLMTKCKSYENERRIHFMKIIKHCSGIILSSVLSSNRIIITHRNQVSKAFHHYNKCKSFIPQT